MSPSTALERFNQYVQLRGELSSLRVSRELLTVALKFVPCERPNAPGYDHPGEAFRKGVVVIVLEERVALEPTVHFYRVTGRKFDTYEQSAWSVLKLLEILEDEAE